MKPEIKQKWVAALRSGKYKQGRGCLRRHDSYCCLGVLCDLHAQVTDWKWSLESGIGRYMGESLLPSGEVQAWAGINTSSPFCEFVSPDVNEGRPVALALLNDGSVDRNISSWTFEQIADVIEKHF